MKFKMAVKLLLASVLLTRAGAAFAAVHSSKGIFLDSYLGPNLTASSDINVNGTSGGRGFDLTFNSVGHKAGSTYGARAGYWFADYLGAGLDIFGSTIKNKTDTVAFNQTLGTLNTSGQAQLVEGAYKFSSTAVGLTLLGRYPFSIVEPYVGIAPAIFYNTLTLGGVDTNGTNFGFEIPIGAKVKAWEQERLSLSFLAEVRFMYNPFSVDLRSGTDNQTVKSNLFTTNFLIGLSLGFGGQ